MIQPSHLVPPSAGTGPIVVVNTSKHALQKANGDRKITDPRYRHRLISRLILLGGVNCQCQAIGRPSFEPLSL